MFVPSSIKDKDLSHLYLAPSKISGAGDGVYSKLDIPIGIIVEKANVIKMPSKKVEETDLMDYVFNNPYNHDEFFVAFGFGSMYNHSDDPHMTYEYNPDENKIIFKAIKDIKKGEEIYISYGPNWWTSRKHKNKVDVIPKNTISTKKYKVKKL
jgi:hypothetical protein